jgi:LysM repeat protein
MFLRTIIFPLFLGFSSAAALAQGVKPIALADNAPDSYVVKKGDTLWAISGQFLSEPWRWPEIWRLNRDQIRNPHRIYPGQVVVLDRSGATPRLKIGQPIKLEPKVYSEPSVEPVPSIPQQVIGPFLAEPLVMEAGGLDRAPKIIATQEDRVMVGPGNIAYVTGIVRQAKLWQVFRPLKPIVDPESNEVLGYEAFFLGDARLLREGEPATVEIVSAKQEIATGDRLVATSKPDIIAYAPHSPDRAIQGRIIGIYAGVASGETGRNYVVTINRGKRDGIEVGHVLAIYRHGRDVAYRPPGGVDVEYYRLPEERYGLAFVFRTFERVSYGLVMDSSRPVVPNDIVRTP